MIECNGSARSQTSTLLAHFTREGAATQRRQGSGPGPHSQLAEELGLKQADPCGSEALTVTLGS